MLKYIISALMFVVAIPSLAAGIEFSHGGFDSALEKARKSKRILFVYVYTEWCGPCKKMAKTVFVQDDVGELFNKYFVNYKLDAEDEDFKGPELAEKYAVNAYPTYLFIDGAGELVAKKGGAMNADAFVVMAMKAASISDDDEEFCRAYKNGDHSIKAFLRCHAKKALDARELAAAKDYSAMQAVRKEYDDYYTSLSDEQRLSRDGFRLISSASMLMRGSGPAEFLVDNYQRFAEFVDPNILASVVVEANKMGIMSGPYTNRDNPGIAKQWVEDIRGKLAAAYKIADPENDKAYEWERLGLEATLKLDPGTPRKSRKQDWNGFLASSVAQANLVGDEEDRLNYLAYIPEKMLMFGCDDKGALRASMVYAAEAWEKKQSFGAAVLYASLLEKTGEAEKAKGLFARAEAMIDQEASEKRKQAMREKLDKATGKG